MRRSLVITLKKVPRVYIYMHRQAPSFARHARLASRTPSYLRLQPLDGGLPSGGFPSKQRIGRRGWPLKGLVSLFRGIWEPPTYGLTEAVWAITEPARGTGGGRSMRAIAVPRPAPEGTHHTPPRPQDTRHTPCTPHPSPVHRTGSVIAQAASAKPCAVGSQIPRSTPTRAFSGQALPPSAVAWVEIF